MTNTKGTGNYIQGTREPDYNTLIRIADCFHVTTDFLLGHELTGNAMTRDEELLLHLFSALNEDQKEFLLDRINRVGKVSSLPFRNYTLEFVPSFAYKDGIL